MPETTHETAEQDRQRRMQAFERTYGPNPGTDTQVLAPAAADLFDNIDLWPEPLFDLTRETWAKGQELEALLDESTADRLEELVQLYERRLSALRDWAYNVGRQEETTHPAD